MTRPRGRPRKAPAGVPPSIAQDADAIAAEAAALDASDPLPPRAPGKKGRKKTAPDLAAGAVAAPPQGGEVVFPVEAIAEMHLTIWNGIAQRLRSRYELSAQGAAEMGRFAEICIRQYLGPYLAEHAALTAYLMTQGTALLALLALRDSTPTHPKSAARDAASPLPRPGVPLEERGHPA